MDLDLKLELQKIRDDRTRAVVEANRAINKLMKPYVPEEPMFFSIGDWECDESPYGWCTYHDYKDQCHDSCIFCGQPEERK